MWVIDGHGRDAVSLLEERIYDAGHVEDFESARKNSQRL